jgi:uncharacterized Zn ribbon protein
LHGLDELAKDLERLGLSVLLRTEADQASLEARGRLKELKLIYFDNGVNLVVGDEVVVILPKDFLIIVNGSKIKTLTSMSTKMQTELLLRDAEIELRVNTRGALSLTVR